MIKDNLHEINSKLPSDVTLVAVSKFHPVERLMEAYNAGQRVFAELAAKVPQMPADVQWHFIGHLQTNKLKLVLPYVSLVQSVDSLHLLQAISTWAVANSRVIDVLLELHLGAEETKQGFSENEIMTIISGAGISSQTASASLRPLPSRNASDDAAVGPSLLHGRGWPWVCEDIPAPMKGVRIRGLMGMASNTEDNESKPPGWKALIRCLSGCPGTGRLPCSTELPWCGLAPTSLVPASIKGDWKQSAQSRRAGTPGSSRGC